MTIAVVQGTRPEIIKNYSIIKALKKRGLPFRVFHTNQHVQDNMRDAIYREMGYKPCVQLDDNYSIGTAIKWLEEGFQKHRISHVIVNGDTAASLAGALAAMYADIPLSHIEAGLRSRDTDMLEERNRIMVDAVAELLFAYTQYEYDVLKQSPDIRGRVFVEGNTTVDLLQDFSSRLPRPRVAKPYLFVTLHRRELTTSKLRMTQVVTALNQLAEDVGSLVFPIHPRTRQALKDYNLLEKLHPGIHQLLPMPILEALGYQKHAAAIVTDSGCVQEEAYLLGVPCITLRENTERHLTLENGANRITGFNPDQIVSMTRQALNENHRLWPPIYGSYGAGDRIIGRILDFMTEQESSQSLEGSR